MSSRLYLYLKTDDGTILRQEKYSGQAERQRIIDKWRPLYGKQFLNLNIEDEEPVLKTKSMFKKGYMPDFGTRKKNRNSLLKKGKNIYTNEV